MTYASVPQSSDPRIVSTSRCYVVYEKETGDVIHIHHSVEFQNGPPVQEDAVKRARRLAGKAGAHAEVIEVDPAHLPRVKKFRIDPKTRTIIQDRADSR
jgi:hypothetical protein